jgi:hypothetical protein
MAEISSSEKIESIFEKYFQKNLEIYIKDSLFKQGKFIIIENKVLNNNYYFELLLERTKKLEVIKIPFPFNVEEHEDDSILYFDYRISTLLKSANIDMVNVYNIVNNAGTIPSRLFDTILELKFK